MGVARVNFASLRSRGAARYVAALIAGVLVVTPVAPALAQAPGAAPAKVDPTEARTQLIAADAAARKRDWASALDHYTQSNLALPTPLGLAGVANAQYQLGKLPEAYASYEELTKTYAGRLSRAQQTDADAKLKDLAAKTCLVTFTAQESGAAVTIDGHPAGTTPLTTPVRLAAGTHTFRATKEGFAPFESTQDVPGGQPSSVNLALARAQTKGTVSVTEKSSQAVRVVVDGNDVGAAPWSGDLDPGPHDISVRSSTAAAPAQHVDLVRGAKVSLEFVAVAAAAHIEVKTSDGKGYIYVDAKLVGEGAYAADVSVGPHTIEVKRDGFETYVKSVVLADKQVESDAVTLHRPGGGEITAGDAERILQGVYGGFGVLGFAQLNSLGTELQTRCPALGASSCDTPNPLGLGVFGYVGYTFNPIGFEVMLGTSFDSTTQRATFDGNTTANPNQNVLLATPARNERFTIDRFGGIGALRVRGTIQGKGWRASLAAGLGLAYRVMAAERKVATADGTNLTERDVYGPGGFSYFSPAVSVDAAIHWRMTQTTALSLGFMLWGENAGNSVVTSPAQNDFLVNTATKTAVPLFTPAYHLASSGQLFVGPYLGMQFGP
jgi:PEGA domain